MFGLQLWQFGLLGVTALVAILGIFLVKAKWQKALERELLRKQSDASHLYETSFHIIPPQNCEEVVTHLLLVAQGLHKRAVAMNNRTNELFDLRKDSATNEQDADHSLGRQRSCENALMIMGKQWDNLMEACGSLGVPTGSEGWRDHVNRPLTLSVPKSEVQAPTTATMTTEENEQQTAADVH